MIIPARVSPQLQSYITSSQDVSSGSIPSDARLQVFLTDVNDNLPMWQGLDDNGYYPAAVSDRTTQGEFVVRVMATDIDGTSPNNEVSGLGAIPIIHHLNH